ncbi:MAG TPA: M1 family metallopeptidase, partial [Flavitalea sp.]|nr:M1 family metallopeptidase [Flavitalea sp.]
DQAEIRISYEGVPKVPDWKIPMDGGVLWDKDSLGNNWAQMVCQGSGASLWWPNKDHQSDEPDSMQIWITVPSEFTEISNGRLIAKTPMAGNQTRYEWKVSYPINNYNVTFSIGKYVHYQDRYISDDTLTIDYYVMPYNLDRAKKMFGQVKPMLKTFQKYFGKYPFPRDGFTLVESLYPMEHQSGVCIGKITAQNSGDTNPLLWHESAHEWWGNAITSKDIADMWIHEAFATYAETLMIEDLFGKDKGNISMTGQVDAVIGNEPVTGVYDVNHIHYDIGDMYSKGSLMLHTFRNVLNNDTLWVKLLHNIQDHFRHQTLSADELIKFINKQTGTDYSYFFDQYLHYTQPPKLEAKLQQSGNNLSVKYRWVANVKNFRMPVKVTKTADQFDFIYPTTEWKTVVLKNVSMSEFDVDEESFYIETHIE